MDSKPTSPDRWLNRNVIGLAINRFLSDFGHEAGTSILPLFLAAIGAPAIALGLIEGVADALSSFAKLFGGWLGDHVQRRKPWAAAGYFLTGVTTGLYGLFAWWPWTLFVRTLGWVGRGLRSPLHDALLTDSIPVSARDGRSASTRPLTQPVQSPARWRRWRSSASSERAPGLSVASIWSSGFPPSPGFLRAFRSWFS